VVKEVPRKYCRVPEPRCGRF